MIIPIKLEKRTEGEREAYAEGYAAGKRDAVRPGSWIKSTDADDGRCSICNCDMPMFKEEWEWRYCETPYCPNCGAQMSPPDEE